LPELCPAILFAVSIDFTQFKSRTREFKLEVEARLAMNGVMQH